jgi:hypothetical protein
MQRETFDQYLKRLDELGIGAKNPNFINEIQKAKEKLISVMPYPSNEIKPTWQMVRGKSVTTSDRIILMNPFDRIEFASSFSKNSSDHIVLLGMLKKTMHEFIDMKCPKYLS